MNLEPAVEKSIRRNKREVALHRAIAVVPLLLIVAGTVLLVIWARTITAGVPSGLKMETGTQASTIAMFFARLLPMFGMFYVAISRLMTPARQQFKDLTTRAAQYDEAALAGFQGDLASVGIGMGVEVPAVEVVAVPTPTAFAFKERCADRIAVTPTLLGAGLSQAEREAVMAHELAHTVDGDGLLEPSVWRGATGIAFIAAPLIVMMTGILGGFSLERMMVVMLVPMMLLVVGWPIALWLLVRRYSIDSAKSLDQYTDILADSVATKVTGNPDAMKSAISKLKELIDAAPQMPSETIAFGHMFIGPLKEWPIVATELLPTTQTMMTPEIPDRRGPSSGLWGVLSSPVGGKHLVPPWPPGREGYSSDVEYMNAKAARTQMGPFIEWQHELISERLINLEYIEQNRWQAFEVRGGRITTKPSSWE